MKLNYINLTLYNKTELLSQLPTTNLTHTNEELMQIAYKEWGEKLFNKISGDFAFAFYNEVEDVLVAVRDALGVKALYYVVDNGQYYFSDNIDELFTLTKIEKKPNLKSMQTLLSNTAVDYEDTMYEGLKRVPPGHYLKVEQGEASLVRYWYPENIETDYAISLEDASTKFRDLFEKAIVARVGSDELTAYELSGGLDSSSVVSMLKNKYPQKKVDTYSMGFDGLNCDETEYIHSVEEKYSFKTTNVASQNIDYTNKFDFKFNYDMNPHWPVTTTFTMMFPMVEQMHKDGKQIIVTGQGGDHLLTGHCTVLGDLLKRREFKKVLKEVMSKVYSFKYMIGCGVLPLIGQKTKNILKKILIPFRKEKSKRIKLADLFQIESISSVLKKSDINVLVATAQSTLMDGNALHVLENIYNVEFRHPFYDKNLVEFVLSLPPEYLYSKGWIKMLLRYSMEDILPDKIRSRRDKADFFEVLLQQLQAIDFKTVLENENLVSLGLIEHKEIDKLIQQFDDGNNKELLHLWTVVNIEYWYQQVNSQK